MAECTFISQEERDRRESFYRMKHRPFDIRDMYTWRQPYKMCSLAICSGAMMISVHNSIYRKPWHYGKHLCIIINKIINFVKKIVRNITIKLYV